MQRSSTHPAGDPAPGPARRGERGEGVISTAIAVLIVAILGAAMWLSFNTIWNDANDNINAKISEIR